jgi:hypothetical protein
VHDQCVRQPDIETAVAQAGSQRICCDRTQPAAPEPLPEHGRNPAQEPPTQRSQDHDANTREPPEGECLRDAHTNRQTRHQTEGFEAVENCDELTSQSWQAHNDRANRSSQEHAEDGSRPPKSVPDLGTNDGTHDQTKKLAQEGFKRGAVPPAYVARRRASIHPCGFRASPPAA